MAGPRRALTVSSKGRGQTFSSPFALALWCCQHGSSMLIRLLVILVDVSNMCNVIICVVCMWSCWMSNYASTILVVLWLLHLVKVTLIWLFLSHYMLYADIAYDFSKLNYGYFYKLREVMEVCLSFISRNSCYSVWFMCFLFIPHNRSAVWTTSKRTLISVQKWCFLHILQEHECWQHYSLTRVNTLGLFNMHLYCTFGHSPQSELFGIVTASVVVQSIVINPSVCVCLSVCHSVSGTTWLNLHQIFVRFPHALAWSSCGCVAIHNVLMVLWMTSPLPVMGHVVYFKGWVGCMQMLCWSIVLPASWLLLAEFLIGCKRWCRWSHALINKVMRVLKLCSYKIL